MIIVRKIKTGWKFQTWKICARFSKLADCVATPFKDEKIKDPTIFVQRQHILSSQTKRLSKNQNETADFPLNQLTLE